MFTPGDSTKYGGHTYILEQSVDRASIVFCHTGGIFGSVAASPYPPASLITGGWTGNSPGVFTSRDCPFFGNEGKKGVARVMEEE